MKSLQTLLCMLAAICTCSNLSAVEPIAENHFEEKVRPILMQYCGECHSPEDEENDVNFLSALKNHDLGKQRSLWSSVVAQLRNRTMPPAEEEQPSEQQRLDITNWLEQYLRMSACEEGEYAGMVTPRRLNGHEYDNTIRDLIGIDQPYSDSFPVDGSGGEGFDNNGETLFLPPILMERYLEAADRILNQAVITPPLQKQFSGTKFLPSSLLNKKNQVELIAGKKANLLVQIHTTANYTLKLSINNKSNKETQLAVLIDGIAAHRFPLTEGVDSKELKTTIRLSRGLHAIALRAMGDNSQVQIKRLELQEQRDNITDSKQEIHDRIFNPGKSKQTTQPKEAASLVIKDFAERAYRRDVTTTELEKLLTLYDRGANRGEPYEEAVKLALKAILVSPHFLFRIEKEPSKSGINPLTDHELATRLSYFLWSSMPDDELLRLADRNELHQEDVLTQQINRMLKDKKSWAFYENFTGQWLGTREVGGRIRPVGTEFQRIYTFELAFELREEPVRLMQHLMKENRSLLEMLSADYTFVTERTAKHYGIENVKGEHFRKVEIQNGQRGGVLKSGAVHLLTAFPNRTSPVLRGAWVLETLLGTPVPSPPPGVPPLDTKSKSNKDQTLREVFEKHREDVTCAACHNVIDPIGFGLENYDRIGRWRTKDNDKPLEVAGVMPSGEKFNSPQELQKIILNRKDEYIRTLTGKMLGYALGRSLEDRDQCTIEQIVKQLEKENYKAREMIKAIVLSTPFRNQQLPETN